MALSEIRFHSPKTITEAIDLLAKLKDARIVAGGTDLLVDLRQGLIEARDIVSIQEIKELKRIEKKDNKIHIGAAVTSQEIIISPLINQYIPALSEAAAAMASSQIRAVATIGGNISSAVPSADLPPPLIAADADVELRCVESIRRAYLSEFFTGPRITICRAEELLTHILIPLLPPNTGISFQKFALREANALAVASVASRLTVQNGRIDKAAIVLGAVAATPLLALKASEYLSGSEPSDDLFEKAALMAKEESRPISDIRGSVWYRKELIQVLARRTLHEALMRAQTKSGRRK
jgi:carbon-monoxide dehydrogenase medium subunit